MKKIFGVLLTSTLILGACSTQDDTSNKDEDTKSGMKSNDPNKDKDNKKQQHKQESNAADNSSNEQSNSNDSNQSDTNDQTNGTSTDSKSSNSKTSNAKTRNDQSTNQTSNVNSTQQATSNQQNTTQQNNGMTQADIDEWNKTKPTTHDESQMGYGRGDYEAAREASSKVWDNPNAHVGGPSWVGKNEGYDSWAKRQQEVQGNSEVLQQ